MKNSKQSKAAFKKAYRNVLRNENRNRTAKAVIPPRPGGKRIAAAIRQQLDEAHHRLDFGPGGLRYLECALNPFGVDHDSGCKSVGARIPDSITNAIPITVTSAGNFSGSTATSGVVELRLPNKTDAVIGYIHRGTDATLISNVPTTSDLFASNEYTITDAMVDNLYNDPQIRLVSAAIRITSTSAPDDTAGLLEAFESRGRCKTGAAT